MVFCFGVRVSVMFHLLFDYYTFVRFWVAEWNWHLCEINSSTAGRLFLMSSVYL